MLRYVWKIDPTMHVWDCGLRTYGLDSLIACVDVGQRG